MNNAILPQGSGLGYLGRSCAFPFPVEKLWKIINWKVDEFIPKVTSSGQKLTETATLEF